MSGRGLQAPSEVVQCDNNVTSINRSANDLIRVSQDLPPYVKPGIYSMFCVGHRTSLRFGKTAKSALRIRIQDQGEFYGKELERHYNCKRLVGRPGKNGNFQVAARGDFLREYLTLFPVYIRRLDRISMQPFRNCVIKGRVDTVNANSRQRTLPKPLQYSVIRELLEVGI